MILYFFVPVVLIRIMFIVAVAIIVVVQCNVKNQKATPTSASARASALHARHVSWAQALDIANIVELARQATMKNAARDARQCVLK